MSILRASKTSPCVRSDKENEIAKSTLEFLENIDFFKPDGKPKTEWKVFYGDTWGRAQAFAHDAACKAARNSIQGMDDFNVEWMRAWRAVKANARDMMFEAGFYARGRALGTMSGDVCNDVEREATLFGTAMFVDGKNFKDKNRILNHVKKRIEVLEKGYALACDVGGTLYVYAQKDPQPIRHERRETVDPISLMDYISSKRK